MYNDAPPPPEWKVYRLCRLLNKLPSEVEAESADAMTDFVECLLADNNRERMKSG